MIKNLTPNQIVLIGIAALLLILAAFSFYLLQNPYAPLPFSPPIGTSSSTPPPPALTIISVPTAVPPTRQTSYTPRAAFITPNNETPTLVGTPLPGTTTSPAAPTSTSSALPTNTLASTLIAPSTSTTTSPTATGTLSPGNYGVVGRVLQNGTPMANVVVEFADDVAPRHATTGLGGHYWFITLAPGANFSLTFKQPDNLQLIPTSDVASLAVMEGTLPTGVAVIDLPDFEVSINLNGMVFELETPVDGASYSAANPIQFNWSLYNQAGTYMVQLGPNGSDAPIWSSSHLGGTTFMWNGTLDDGTHISPGSYWWRVSITKSAANYTFVAFTQQFDLLFTP